MCIEPHIDPAPVPHTQDMIGTFCYGFDFSLQLAADFCWTMKYLKRFFRDVPDPLGLIGVHWPGARWQLIKTDRYNGKHLHRITIPPKRNRKFITGQKRFNNNGLLIFQQLFTDHISGLGRIFNDRSIIYPLAASFSNRFHDSRKYHMASFDRLMRSKHLKGWCSNLIRLKNLFGPHLVQTNAESQRIRSCIGQSETFTEQGNIGFTKITG